MTEGDVRGYPMGFPWKGAFVIPDVQRQGWWPYRPVEGRVDSLWLLGEDATMAGSFGRLMAEWGSSVGWLAAGTAASWQGAEPASWAVKYPELAEERVGRLVLEGGSQLNRTVEWWRVKAHAAALHRLLQGPLLHPGTGWWLAAETEPGGSERFVNATSGLLWWLARNYKPYQGRVHEIVDDSVKEALLALLPQIGFVSVVALNNHPVSGAVLFGVPEVVRAAADSIGEVRVSADGAEVRALLARGGWLATG